jgi:hypothetical protein|tara:strand:+ start:436 stop:573 length:138 start_codon:yes stop_codon:yes gene_type:complete
VRHGDKVVFYAISENRKLTVKYVQPVKQACSAALICLRNNHVVVE